MILSSLKELDEGEGNRTLFYGFGKPFAHHELTFRGGLEPPPPP